MKAGLILLATTGSVLLLSSLAALGCHQSMTDQAATATQDDQDLQTVAQAPTTGGARVWAENCMRCHNLRRPRERSDREWDIITHHMRVRANLTGEEHRLIAQFLKSAN